LRPVRGCLTSFWAETTSVLSAVYGLRHAAIATTVEMLLSHAT